MLKFLYNFCKVKMCNKRHEANKEYYILTANILSNKSLTHNFGIRCFVSWTVSVTYSLHQINACVRLLEPVFSDFIA